MDSTYKININMGECTPCLGGGRKNKISKGSCSNIKFSELGAVRSSDIIYTGPSLSTLNIPTGTNYEDVIILINEFLQEGLTIDVQDWSIASCIDHEGTIRSVVEGMSEEICSVISSVDSKINNGFNSLDITHKTFSYEECDGSISSKTLSFFAQSVTRDVCDVNDYVSIQGVDWTAAGFSVLNNPSNIKESFDEIIRQLKLVKDNSGGTANITVDTTSSCLPTKGSSTPVATAVGELISAYCSDKFDTNELDTRACIDTSSVTGIMDMFNLVTDEIQDLITKTHTFDDDYFETVPNSGACSGSNVTLKDTFVSDTHKVSLDNLSAPDYLDQLIGSGTNVTVVKTGGKLVISSSNTDNKVSAGPSSVPGDLGSVLNVSSVVNGLSLSKLLVGDQLVVKPVFDDSLFVDYILTVIQNNPVLLNKLCNITCQCDGCS